MFAEGKVTNLKYVGNTLKKNFKKRSMELTMQCSTPKRSHGFSCVKSAQILSITQGVVGSSRWR